VAERRRRISREAGRELFGLDPAGYDAARPGHPDRVYRTLGERCGLAPGARVLEVGPGTGQATRRLLELGAQVTAVEPNRALADYLLAAMDCALTVRNETIEESNLPAQAFDLATAASSFHWVDEDAGLARIYAALRPSGSVALWWTLFGAGEGSDPFAEEVRRAVDAACAAHGVELERSPSGGFESAPPFGLDVEARRAALGRAGFDRFHHELIPWPYTWDTARIRGLYASFSPVIRLESEPRTAVLDAVAAVVDGLGGSVEWPLRTSLFTARRAC
jgi:SAM-dependent methyltransferase